MATIEEIQACRKRWLTAVASGKPAGALVEDTLGGCREAVAYLGRQLTSLSYPVSGFLLPSPGDLDERVARTESRTGVRIPTLIHEFWRIVGGIAFVDLRQYKHVAFWDDLAITGTHQFSDGVYVDACDDDWFAFTVEDFSGYAENDDEQSFLYTLAPDGYHKDDISGGPPYSVGCGSDWAPAWENFSWSGYRRPDTAVPDPTDFVSYLRTALLECAGFPGFFGHAKFEDIRQDMVRSLKAF
ncbi:MAG: hypothetical protein ACYC6Y_19660 [Thermoguttaceae bacterium]